MTEKVVVERRGRIVVPSPIRKVLGIREGMVLEADLKDGKIILKPVRKISAKDLLGVGGRERVDVEEIEESLGDER